MNWITFRKLLLDRGVTVSSTADVLGVNKTTVYRWKRNPGAMSMDAAKKLVTALHLSLEETGQLFFAQEVARNETSEVG